MFSVGVDGLDPEVKVVDVDVDVDVDVVVDDVGVEFGVEVDGVCLWIMFFRVIKRTSRHSVSSINICWQSGPWLTSGTFRHRQKSKQSRHFSASSGASTYHISLRHASILV